MLFNSFSFWVFFLAVALGYKLLRHRGQNVLLLAASWFFYSCWDWRFLSLLIATTGIAYYTGRQLASSEDTRLRRRWLVASVIAHLVILGFFKYFGFFAEELARLLTAVGIHPPGPVLKVVLPVGISFYTFQGLGYVVDVFRRQVSPASSFWNFSLYLAFFPQLVAGPIERSSQLLPQVETPRPPLDRNRFSEGFFHVVSGLFRKVVLADNMAWLANDVFSRPAEELTALEVVVGTWAFAFQIYGDFSGYSSIAIGLAKWLGFDLMENFRQPYFALNPRDFWSRWHISLSTWLRDYLYIPLGGNRQGPTRTYANLMITMLLGGLWHGASWNFVIWGGIHGVWLAIHRALDTFSRDGSKRPPQRASTLKVAAAWFVTFHLVCISWLFFRSPGLSESLDLLRVLGGGWGFTAFSSTGLSLILFFAGPILVLDAWIEKKGDTLALIRCHWLPQGLVYAYLLAMMLFFPPPAAADFIYFQF